MATAKKEVNLVEIKPTEIEEVTIRIEGTTSLITHTWSEKAKKEILDRQMGTVDKSKKREPKNPIEDFIRSMYWITDMPTEFTEEAYEEAIKNGARFGFPVDSIKLAAISAAYRREWIPNKMAARGMFFIKQDAYSVDGSDVVEIHFNEPPRMREDNVTIGMGTADLRYRGEFRDWYIDLRIRYDRNGVYSINDIVNFINAGGFTCGIGEWRPERDGQHGMYRVVPVT